MASTLAMDPQAAKLCVMGAAEADCRERSASSASSGSLSGASTASTTDDEESDLLAKICECPPVAIFFLTEQYHADPNPNKLNLGVGAYRNSEGSPWVLPVVSKAEAHLGHSFAGRKLNHEYLPMDGLDAFTMLASSLVLGSDSSVLADKRAVGIQALGGTGALRLAAEFLGEFHRDGEVYISDPSWPNHVKIFQSAGLSTCTYRYYGADRGLDFAGMVADLQAAKQGSVVVLHACAHNPTGLDPNFEQWQELGRLCKSKRFFVVFDCAYLGFASGDLDKDSAAIRLFVDMGISLFVAQSFSKNFGLYDERVGNLIVVSQSPSHTKAVTSQLAMKARAMWSTPAAHGARIVAMVLGNSEMRRQWVETVRSMADRILSMREALVSELQSRAVPGRWDHITSQSGMFCYSGLNQDHVAFLQQRFSVYLPKDGRINICALTSTNVAYLADAIHEAVKAV